MLEETYLLLNHFHNFLEIACLASPIIIYSNLFFVGKKYRARKQNTSGFANFLLWVKISHWLLDPNPRGWGVLFAPFFVSFHGARSSWYLKQIGKCWLHDKSQHKVSIYSWWFQPNWKTLVKLGSFPQVGEKKHIWNPRPEFLIGIIISTQLDLHYEMKRVIPTTRLYRLGEQLHGVLSWWNSPKEVDVTARFQCLTNLSRYFWGLIPSLPQVLYRYLMVSFSYKPQSLTFWWHSNPTKKMVQELQKIHPWQLRWNLKMLVSNRVHLLFHVQDLC